MRGSFLAASVLVATGLIGPAESVYAQFSVASRTLLRDESPPLTRTAPASPEAGAAESNSSHTLDTALQFARSRYLFLQKNVRDFTCLLVKRERIEGRLKGYEYLRTRARLRKAEGGKVSVPLSLYMHFLAPAELKDRKVLYVEGQNSNKMLVRNGGKRFSYVTVKIAPDSDAAMRESRYPVTELSLETVARRMIEKAEDDVRFDPTNSNTEVVFYKDASVDGRKCTRIQVTHPKRGEHFSYHIANVFVDDDLNVPIRVEGYDWPAAGSTEPVLLEEYTFTKLRLNVGLTDQDFLPSLVEN